MEVFLKFYKKLLSSPQTTPKQSSTQWLDEIQLPTLSSKQSEALNAPCTEIEVIKIIGSLKTSTAPGPDGFSSSYYKKFASVLIPHLVKLFNHVLQDNQFPSEMLLANMSLLPKPNKDHSSPQNFRPISIIDNDLKIFGKILADRLASVISPLIHPDQTGFIPDRQITDNIRLATNIIQDSNLHARSTLLLSLDIHKAFDSVSWSYLDSLLPRYGIGDEFLHGFKALYHDPHTRIKLP